MHCRDRDFCRDPINKVKEMLESRSLVDEMDIKKIEVDAKQVVKAAEKEGEVRTLIA